MPKVLRPLDPTDLGIINALLRDARMPNARLAQEAGVALSTALVRPRALMCSGVIRGFRADVDPASVGRPVQALIAVRLRAYDRGVIESFARRLRPSRT
jgi:DNA-binding Lrp family transcriptional regulator